MELRCHFTGWMSCPGCQRWLIVCSRVIIEAFPWSYTMPMLYHNSLAHLHIKHNIDNIAHVIYNRLYYENYQINFRSHVPSIKWHLVSNRRRVPFVNNDSNTCTEEWRCRPCHHSIELWLFPPTFSHHSISFLTNWGRDKMAAQFWDEMVICIFLNETVWI